MSKYVIREKNHHNRYLKLKAGVTSSMVSLKEATLFSAGETIERLNTLFTTDYYEACLIEEETVEEVEQISYDAIGIVKHGHVDLEGDDFAIICRGISHHDFCPIRVIGTETKTITRRKVVE